MDHALLLPHHPNVTTNITTNFTSSTQRVKITLTCLQHPTAHAYNVTSIYASSPATPTDHSPPTLSELPSHCPSLEPIYNITNNYPIPLQHDSARLDPKLATAVAYSARLECLCSTFPTGSYLSNPSSQRAGNSPFRQDGQYPDKPWGVSLSRLACYFDLSTHLRNPVLANRYTYPNRLPPSPGHQSLPCNDAQPVWTRLSIESPDISPCATRPNLDGASGYEGSLAALGFHVPILDKDYLVVVPIVNFPLLQIPLKSLVHLYGSHCKCQPWQHLV